MAARRVEVAGETIRFDHGAQYFTARDPAFRSAVEAWEAQGVVARWKAALKSEEDLAFVGTPGMNAPIRAMSDVVGGVLWNTRIDNFAHEDGLWRLTSGASLHTADTVLIAVPAEQARDLLQPASPTLAALPARVTSEPCWAVMAAFDARLDIAADTLRDPAKNVSWAARNSTKPGRSSAEAWTLHASSQRSHALVHYSGDQAAEVLLADFFEQTGIAPIEPIHISAHRWLYAQPTSLKGEPAYFDAALRIGIAGDYLHSPRVEGAWLSGSALAQLLLS